MNKLSKLFAVILTATFSFIPSLSAVAAEGPQVRVASDFINIHLGPAVETPIFYVAEKDEWMVLTNRRTGWFKVQTENGVEGWISENELVFTLDGDGNPVTYNPSLVKNFISSISK
ncbi:SH3 domain-containing protein [Thalassotalea litorea]|uniref:SH3 domain-containing protein n=1 Tax=Thalassotalea litorea TaxID=2020715 RepID=UPI0037359B92